MRFYAVQGGVKYHVVCKLYKQQSFSMYRFNDPLFVVEVFTVLQSSNGHVRHSFLGGTISAVAGGLSGAMAAAKTLVVTTHGDHPRNTLMRGGRL